jgi:hypothetical protein
MLPRKIKWNEAMQVNEYIKQHCLHMDGHQTRFLASNYHKDNEVVPISRRLKNGQHIIIACPKAVKDYNQFSHGVD